MKGKRKSLAELHILWNTRLEEAKEYLAQARSDVKKFKAEIQLGNSQTANIHDAYQKALRTENFALAKYAKILTVVADLTLFGKAPDEKPSEADRQAVLSRPALQPSATAGSGGATPKQRKAWPGCSARGNNPQIRRHRAGTRRPTKPSSRGALV